MIDIGAIESRSFDTFASFTHSLRWMERFSERIVSIIRAMSQIYGLDRVFFHKLHHPPYFLCNFADNGRGVSKPKTEDRRLGNPLNEMCWNAFFDTKTMKSTRSSFCILPASNYKTKTFAKTLYLTLKHWNRWGLRVVVLPTSNYKMKTLAKTLYLTLKHWIRWESS